MYGILPPDPNDWTYSQILLMMVMTGSAMGSIVALLYWTKHYHKHRFKGKKINRPRQIRPKPKGPKQG